MSVEQLQRLVASGSVRSPNYFNGRLLSAGDLRQEREAAREFLARVSRAAGSGVAYGFEVTAGADRRQVRVRAGLALGPYGDPLQLDDDIDLDVTVSAPPAPAPAATDGAAGFRRCQPPPAGPTPVTNPGLHLLAVGPAGGADGSVATSGLGSTVACALKDNINGLRFVLLPFRRALEKQLRDDPSTAGGGAGQRSRFRSRAARACFGADDVFPPAAGASGRPGFGALATVTDPALPGCHVPLALLNISTAGVDFIDMWAARRGLAAPSAAGPWGPWVEAPPRRVAQILQFQGHLASLVDELKGSGDLASVSARDYFVFLPPFGVVPVTNGLFEGFDAAAFFAGRASGLFPARHLQGAGGNLSFLPRIDPDSAATIVRAALNTPPAANADGLFLQRYLIAADDAVPDGPFRVLFTLRDTHGPVEDDDVAEVLRDAADAYSAVLSRAVLMPRPITAASIVGWTTLQGLQLAVIQSATLDAASASLRGLDQRGVVSAFRRLLRVQESLAAGAAGDVADDQNQAARKARAKRLDDLLHKTVAGGSPGLKPTLDATPPLIPAILFAQNEINKEVRAWTADVAVGAIRVSVTAIDSTTLVPDSGKKYRFKVTVSNRTTAAVEVQLTPAVVAGGQPAPKWGTPVVTDELGRPLTTLGVARDGEAAAVVALVAPASAAVPVGQTATLQVTGYVPFPSDLTDVGRFDIATARTDTPPPRRVVKLVEDGSQPQAEEIAPGLGRACKFVVSCEGVADAVEVTFTALAKCVPAPGPAEWRASVNGQGALGAGPAADQFQVAVPVRVNPAGATNVTLRVTAPTARPAAGTKTFEYTVSAKLPAAGPDLPEVVAVPLGNPTYSLKVSAS